MSYRVEFSRSAKKQFKKLPSNIRERVEAKIDELAIEPRPNRVKKLQGDDKLISHSRGRLSNRLRNKR